MYHSTTQDTFRLFLILADSVDAILRVWTLQLTRCLSQSVFVLIPVPGESPAGVVEMWLAANVAVYKVGVSGLRASAG